MQNEIVKLFLYGYPYLNGLAEASEVAARNRALLSFGSRRPAEETAAGVADEFLLAAYLRGLFEELTEVLSALTGERYRRIAEKYFLRMSQEESGLAPRSYYRMQAAALKCVRELLIARGWTDEVYFARFGEFAPFMRLYAALRRGWKPQPQKSCSSWFAGFLPRSASTATTTAAPHTARMRTICRTEEASDGGASEGSVSAGPAGTFRKSSFRSKESSSSAGMKPKVSPSST